MKNRLYSWVNAQQKQLPKRLMVKLLRHIVDGVITVRFPDGTQETFGTQGKKITLDLHHPRAIWALLIGGRAGFCVAYVEGYWSSSDVEGLFSLASTNQDQLQKILAGRWWYRALGLLTHARRANHVKGARRNIIAHYDLGNDFYEAWLDGSMTYSSGLFLTENTTLEEAQRLKYERIGQLIDIKAGQQILEIGCGWGGFAEFAARKNAQITGITISPSQQHYALQRLQQKNLTADIRLCDYRHLSGQFDRIVSIEMLEAVGEKYWPIYFAQIAKLLKAGGMAVIQVITIREQDYAQYRREPDFIQQHIFPGGMLPTRRHIAAIAAEQGLQIIDSYGFGKDYATTLRHWNTRFQEAWPRLRQNNFNEQFRRKWEQYFHYCAAGFSTGAIDVCHITLGKPAINIAFPAISLPSRQEEEASTRQIKVA
ncbi:MAG: class I SAM-dependent methyltransferase [Alphaproteobacteria bacterium]